MMRLVVILGILLAAKAGIAAEDPHAGHAAPAGPADPHAGHKMPAPPAGAAGVPIPRDHAADSIFGADVMAAAREALHHEHGGHVFSKVMVNTLEYGAFRGEDGVHWEGEAWIGGDINRAVLKTEGEAAGGGVHDAEVQALYSRAIGPYFDLQAGVRHDIEPRPSRTYAVLGVEGLAPYWFEVGAAAFVSDKGDVLARVEASYDQMITQRLVLEPRAELNFAAQSMAAQGIGRGLSDVEMGLRLRYEFRREFAPYLGITYRRKIGASADLAHAAGEGAGETGVVFGVRTWF